MPYLTAYQDNAVLLDPKGAATSVEFQRTALNVAPYAGAVVPLHFATRTGQPVVIVLQQDGRGVPLGAEVSDADGRTLGVVGAGRHAIAARPAAWLAAPSHPRARAPMLLAPDLDTRAGRQ